jgi:hypothetical protein
METITQAIEGQRFAGAADESILYIAEVDPPATIQS